MEISTTLVYSVQNVAHIKKMNIQQSEFYETRETNPVKRFSHFHFNASAFSENHEKGMFFKINLIVFNGKFECENRRGIQILRNRYRSFGDNIFVLTKTSINFFVSKNIRRTLKYSKIWKTNIHKFLERRFKDKVENFTLKITNIQMSQSFQLSPRQVIQELIPEIDRHFEIHHLEIVLEPGAVDYCSVEQIYEQTSFMSLTVKIQDVYPDKTINLKIIKCRDPQTTGATLIIGHFSSEIKRFVLFLEQEKWQTRS